MYVCMHAWMDGWMYGCMDGWMDGCMDVWMYGCMDVWMYGCMYVCMYMHTDITYIQYNQNIHICICTTTLVYHQYPAHHLQ